MRFLSIEGLCNLSLTEFSREAVRKHQDTVLNTLKVREGREREKDSFNNINLYLYVPAILLASRVRLYPLLIIPYIFNCMS